MPGRHRDRPAAIFLSVLRLNDIDTRHGDHVAILPMIDQIRLRADRISVARPITTSVVAVCDARDALVLNLFQPAEGARPLVEACVDAHEEEDFFNLRARHTLFERHSDVRLERRAGTGLIGIDDIDGNRDERLGSLIDERKSPDLSRHPRAKLPELRVNGLQSLLQFLIAKHGIFCDGNLAHCANPFPIHVWLRTGGVQYQRVIMLLLIVSLFRKVLYRNHRCSASVISSSLDGGGRRAFAKRT